MLPITQAPTHSALPELTVRFGSNDSVTPVTALVNPEDIRRRLHRQLAALKDSVFLSYSTKDRYFAVWLKDEFRKDNLAVWRDGDKLEPGSLWMDEIMKALEACRAMVLLLSPDSVESQYVTLELDAFQSRGKPIFPVLVRPCNIPGGLDTGSCR